jgi:hypothetical protein
LQEGPVVSGELVAKGFGISKTYLAALFPVEWRNLKTRLRVAKNVRSSRTNVAALVRGIVVERYQSSILATDTPGRAAASDRRMVLRQVLTLAGMGLALGYATARWAGCLVESFLYI